MQTCFRLFIYTLFFIPYGISAQPEDAWIRLFNGTDLAGWDYKIANYAVNDNFNQTFRVEGGAIKVGYDDYKTFGGEFGHLFYNQPFSHYKLHVEYRFTGTQTPGGPEWANRNSGVMIHSQSARSMSLKQAFPVSIEVQMLGGLGDGPRTTGNLCTPGTYVEINGKDDMRHCFNSRSATYDGDQWVSLEVEVYGDSLVRHWVNGQPVLEYRKLRIGESKENLGSFLEPSWFDKVGKPLEEGYIALQAESSPVEFRNVKLVNFKGCMNPACPEYKPWHRFAGPCSCQSAVKTAPKKDDPEWRLHNDWAWLGRFQDANNRLPFPDANSKRIVFIGNSITEGWQYADPDYFDKNGYINRGISGQTTPQMLVRFRQDVIELMPQAVVILAGTNDIAGNTGATTIEAIFGNLKSMAELAQTNGIKPVICSILPVYDYPWKPGLKPAPQIAFLNDMLRAFALSNDFAYVDYHSAMKDARGGLRPEFGDDGVHPNAAGYAVMQKLLEKVLEEVKRP